MNYVYVILTSNLLWLCEQRLSEAAAEMFLSHTKEVWVGSWVSLTLTPDITVCILPLTNSLVTERAIGGIWHLGCKTDQWHCWRTTVKDDS